jgi:hypothetical protein
MARSMGGTDGHIVSRCEKFANDSAIFELQHNCQRREINAGFCVIRLSFRTSLLQTSGPQSTPGKSFEVKSNEEK